MDGQTDRVRLNAPAIVTNQIDPGFSIYIVFSSLEVKLPYLFKIGFNK